MKQKMGISCVISMITLLIGLYMIFAYAGSALAPTLSGAAFSLIAVRQMMCKKK